jgi:hypothetical protein
MLNKRILKVGVGVYDDLMRVKEDYGVPFRGYLDIGKHIRNFW